MDWSKLGDVMACRTPDLMDGGGHFAVLVPLVELEGEIHLLYEVRAKKMRRQPGEICFPGGQMETGESPLQTALRETWEELGINKEQITVLGQLDFLVHRTNYILHPVLARVKLDGLHQLTLSEGEVDEVFLVPLSHLQSASEEVYTCTLTPQPEETFTHEKLGLSAPYSFRPGREQIPIYRWQKHIIWGVTGKITRHLLALLKGEGL